MCVHQLFVQSRVVAKLDFVQVYQLWPRWSKDDNFKLRTLHDFKPDSTCRGYSRPMEPWFWVPGMVWGLVDQAGTAPSLGGELFWCSLHWAFITPFHQHYISCFCQHAKPICDKAWTGRGLVRKQPHWFHEGPGSKGGKQNQSGSMFEEGAGEHNAAQQQHRRERKKVVDKNEHEGLQVPVAAVS